MIYLILLLFLAFGKSQHFSGLLPFSNGNQQRNVSLKYIDSPLIVYSISDMSFNDSLALDITYSQIVQASVIRLTFKIITNNYNVSYTLGVKYLITQQLKGWKQQYIELNSYKLKTNWTTGDILNVNSPIIKEVKQGYFVTGFSNSSLLGLITIQKPSTFQYEISFVPTKVDDWVKIIFIRIDFSSFNGCPLNDIFSHQLSSDGNDNVQEFSVSQQPNVIIMLGMTSIYNNKGSIRWNLQQYQSIVSDYGRFSYNIIQIDTGCTIKNSNIMIKNRKQITLKHHIKQQQISVSQIQISQTELPPTNIYEKFGGFKPQNSSLPPYDLPTIQNPVINGSGYPLPFKNTEIRHVVLDVPIQQQQLIQTQQHPFEPMILRPDQAQKLEQNQSYAHPIVATFASPQIVKTVENTLVQQRTIEPFQDQVSFQKINEIQQQIDNQKAKSYHQVQISAWKILGFVILIWLAISFISLPILCCALRKAKKYSENIEIQDRILPISTDVRLISNDVVQQPSEAVGQIRNRNSLRSQITVEMVAPKQSSEPNSDMFKSDKGSSISPLPSTIKQQILTYQQLKTIRAQSLQNYQNSSSKNDLQKVQNSQNFQDSKSDNVSSSKVSNSPSSNLIQLTQQTELKQPTEDKIQYKSDQQKIHQQKIQYISDIHAQNQMNASNNEQNETLKENLNNGFKQQSKVNMQNQQSNYDFQSCIGDQNDVFTNKPSELSELNVQTSRLESKINNLFGKSDETNNQNCKEQQQQSQQQQQQRQQQQSQQKQEQKQKQSKQQKLQQQEQNNQQQQEQKQFSKVNESFQNEFKSQASKFSQIKQISDKKQLYKSLSQNQNQIKMKQEEIEERHQNQSSINYKQEEPSSPEEIEETRKKSSEQQN